MRKPYNNSMPITQVLVRPVPTKELLDAQDKAAKDGTSITELVRTLLVAYANGDIRAERDDQNNLILVV